MKPLLVAPHHLPPDPLPKVERLIMRFEPDGSHCRDCYYASTYTGGEFKRFVMAPNTLRSTNTAGINFRKAFHRQLIACGKAAEGSPMPPCLELVFYNHKDRMFAHLRDTEVQTGLERCTEVEMFSVWRKDFDRLLERSRARYRVGSVPASEKTTPLASHSPVLPQA